MAAKTTTGGKKTAKSATAKSSTAKRPAKAKGTTGTDLVRRVTWDRVANKKQLPDFDTGDSVGVYVKVKEGEKERIQLFAGVVIKVQGSGIARSFTVRKISSGVGVERTFPVLSPIIDRIEVMSHGKVRRGRLFYLRGLKGRSARLESAVYFNEAAPGAADEVATEAAPEGAAPAEEKKPEKKADKKADKKAEKSAKN